MHVEVKGAVKATSPKVHSAQEEAESDLKTRLGEAEAQSLIDNRVKRDGDKAHITLLGPQDSKKAIALMVERDGISKGEAEKKLKELAKEGVVENFTVKGLGKAESGGKTAYFVVVDWPGGEAFRESLGLDPKGQDFHITVGFGVDGDVHGVPKNRVLSASLRSQVIRLAYQNPDLRPHLLPILKR